MYTHMLCVQASSLVVKNECKFWSIKNVNLVSLFGFWGGGGGGGGDIIGKFLSKILAMPKSIMGRF